MITTSMIYKNTKRINDQVGALDIAMECAAFLEQSGAFVYRNWEDGELVGGPLIENYYVGISLMFPSKKTPDPAYIARLTNMDCIVEMNKDHYHRVYYERNTDVKFGENMFKKLMSKHEVWIINIKIPQRYLVIDGNTIFNVDGRDMYYDDLEATYDEDASTKAEESSGDGGGDNDFGGEDDDGGFDL